MKKKKGKKKFRRFFWKRFPVCLLLGGLLIVYQVKRFGWDIRSLREQLFYAIMVPAEIGLREHTWTKYDAQGRLSDALAIVSTAIFSESTAFLYQPETGEIHTAEPFAQASVWQNGESRTYTLRDQTLINQLDESAGYYTAFYSSFESCYLIYSIYVKDDQFVPGEVFMQKKDVLPFLPRYLKAGTPIRGAWVDLSPDNTEGWTKVCRGCSKDALTVYPDYSRDTAAQMIGKSAEELSADGRQYLDAVVVSGSPNQTKTKDFTEAFKAAIPERFEALLNVQENVLKQMYAREPSADMLQRWHAGDQKEAVRHINAYYQEQRENLPEQFYQDEKSIGTLVNVRDHELRFKTEDVFFRNQTWKLVRFTYLNPDHALPYFYLIYVGPVLVLYILLSVFAAMLWAVISYLLYSRRYDLEAYRKNLTGTLAHDLKTPLAVIYGNAENIRAHTHPDQADDYADRIMENVTHIDEMIAGVLGLAKLENGAAPANHETVDLTALLHTAFLRSAEQMEQRGLTLKESGKMAVKGNADMLKQLAENLAANAVQHAAEGGTITVSAEKKALRISNPYIGELNEKTLCEPFRRGDAARGSQSGSGLGLSIVQQIAALQKLRLRVTARDGVFTAELKRRIL